jgi:hypothetical protein
MRTVRSAEQFSSSRLDRCQGLGYRIRVARNVAGVGELQVGERLHIEPWVVLRPESSRRLAHRHRPESGARTEADATIEGCPEDRDVAALEIAQLWQAGEARRSRIAR